MDFNFQGQILCMSRLEETVEDAEFVFEACVENMIAKQEVFESKFTRSCFLSILVICIFYLMKYDLFKSDYMSKTCLQLS